MTEIDLTPITRLEYDIDAILNDHAVAEPITRIELILADIVAGNTTTVVPVTRIETYLAIISGADYPVPEPVTRIETFLAIIAGEDYETPEAVTRLEGLLAEWVEKGSGIWKTVTGALIHITDALASPMQKCEVTLEPVQAGSGDPSPDNVRPITGWTGCKVTRTGKNLINKADRVEYISAPRRIKFGVNQFSDSVANGSLKLEAGDYVFSLSGDNSTNAESISIFDESGTRIKVVYNNKVCSFTVSTTGAYWIEVNITSQNFVSWDNYDIQLERGTTPTDFEEFQGNTYSVTFPALGKNLLKTAGLTNTPPTGTGYSNTTPRTFTADSWFAGLTANNYYNASNAATNVTVSENDIKYTVKAPAYGVAIPIVGLKPETEYTLTCTFTGDGRICASFYKQDGTFISNSVAQISRVTFTIPAETYYSVLTFSASGSSTAGDVIEATNIQLEAGSSATSYEPYTNTVYGGKYEFVGGNGNKEQEIFDLGDVLWASDPNRPGVFYGGGITGRKAASDIIYCSIYKVNNVAVITSKDFYISGKSSYGSNAIFIRDTRFAGYTGSQVKTALQGEKIVFVLDESTTFSSTPQPINTLAGENNVWGDGTIEMTYKAQA